MIERIDGIVGAFDSFRIEEAYNWHDDIMEITRRVVHETDKARLNNIAEHFKVDLSEIREFFEMKRKKMQKPQTNADRIMAMSDNMQLAIFFASISGCPYDREISIDKCESWGGACVSCWHDWLKAPAEGCSE